jgi:hypothetical protein
VIRPLRWATCALLLAVSVAATACPICFRGITFTTLQQLNASQRAVLAQPSRDGKQLRIVAVIKGDGAVGELLVSESYPVDQTTRDMTRPLLMLRGDLSPAWLSAGSIGIEHAGWLRRIARSTPDTNASEGEWREHVMVLLPDLFSPEPMVSDIAYTELSRAPYVALRALKPQLDAAQLARLLDHPARASLFTLLFGIAGGPEDATVVEQRVDVASKSNDATHLAALLAADLELRGPDRLEWLEKTYFSDRNRTLPEIEAALLALSVQGTANGAVPRERVIQAYRFFMRERKPMAGFVVQDLAAWNYWDAGPEYLMLLRTNAIQDPASRYAIVSYLMRSPRADTKAAIKAFADSNP